MSNIMLHINRGFAPSLDGFAQSLNQSPSDDYQKLHTTSHQRLGRTSSVAAGMFVFAGVVMSHSKRNKHAVMTTIDTNMLLALLPLSHVKMCTRLPRGAAPSRFARGRHSVAQLCKTQLLLQQHEAIHRFMLPEGKPTVEHH